MEAAYSIEKNQVSKSANIKLVLLEILLTVVKRGMVFTAPAADTIVVCTRQCVFFQLAFPTFN